MKRINLTIRFEDGYSPEDEQLQTLVAETLRAHGYLLLSPSTPIPLDTADIVSWDIAVAHPLPVVISRLDKAIENVRRYV